MLTGRAAALVFVLLVLGASTAHAAPATATELPASGRLTANQVAVREAPRSTAVVESTLHQFRSDFRLPIVLAIAATQDARGARRLELSLPGRPNGQRGWVPASAVTVRPVSNEIVVHRGARRLEVRRIADGAVLLRAPVAVGMPGAETPPGGDFYVDFASCRRSRSRHVWSGC